MCYSNTVKHFVTYQLDPGGPGVLEVLVVQQRMFLRQNRKECTESSKDRR